MGQPNKLHEADSMPEFLGPERRHIDRQLSQLEKTQAEQAKIVAQLVVISENNAKSMTKIDTWVASHETDYRIVRERLLSQEMVGGNISKQVSLLTSMIESTMNQYLADRNRAVGGWFTVAAVSGAVVAASALAAALHSIGLF